MRIHSEWRPGAVRASLSLVFALLLTNLAAIPAAAQDAEPLGAQTFLPLVTLDSGATVREVSMVGTLKVGEEPVFDVPPKAQTEEVEGPLPAPEVASTDEAKVSGEELPAAADGWTTLLTDGFESVPWPYAGWSLFDSNGTTGGTYYWDDESYRPYRGGWSGWPAGNALNPASSAYPNLMRSWMIYGPMNLSDAAQATFTFQYWNKSELNYDWLFWAASPDGSRFYGNWVSGESGGWRPGVIDLSNVPGYGSMLGDASVYIGFYFYSDSTTRDVGPFIDDIFVQKLACPGGFTARWYNSLTRSPTTQRAVTCESAPYQRNWGTSSMPWTAADNWSLEMNGKPYFNTSKTWTFKANSDDGVRVWVDAALVINAWYDQSGTTTHTGTRYLTAGYHDVYVEYYDRTGAAQLWVRWE